MYVSEDINDYNGYVNNMGPVDTIPQIVIIECNPAYEDDTPLGTPRNNRKYVTVPETRYKTWRLFTVYIIRIQFFIFMN